MQVRAFERYIPFRAVVRCYVCDMSLFGSVLYVVFESALILDNTSKHC